MGKEHENGFADIVPQVGWTTCKSMVIIFLLALFFVSQVSMMCSETTIGSKKWESVYKPGVTFGLNPTAPCNAALYHYLPWLEKSGKTPRFEHYTEYAGWVGSWVAALWKASNENNPGTTIKHAVLDPHSMQQNLQTYNNNAPADKTTAFNNDCNRAAEAMRKLGFTQFSDAVEAILTLGLWVHAILNWMLSYYMTAMASCSMLRSSTETDPVQNYFWDVLYMVFSVPIPYILCTVKLLCVSICYHYVGSVFFWICAPFLALGLFGQHLLTAKVACRGLSSAWGWWWGNRG